jgi:hypothetical protein
MRLNQIFLPLYDNNKQPFSQSPYDKVRSELTETFGGVTAFVRSPAEGIWKQDDDNVHRDDVVIFEVIVDSINHEWWAQYRQALEQRFSQKEILITSTGIEKL